MTRSIATLASMVVFMRSIVFAAEEQPRFSCSGYMMIEPTVFAQTPESVQLTLSSAKNVSIKFGQSDNNARVVSDNRIQLKFQTKEFSGEFFHYTNDLFLIYKSGHLARLSCNRG
jgi:hypothetical protein